MNNLRLLTVALLVMYVWHRFSAKTAPVYYKKKLLGGYNARTIPPIGIYIAAEHKDNDALLQHEQYHWEQYRRMGLPLFYITYFLENILHGYDCNALEIEARGNESDYCRYNYTECVRSGLSATIYNPTFRM